MNMKRISLLIPSLLLCQMSFAEEVPEVRESEKWKFTLGAGAAFVPRYEGSATRRVRAVPVFESRKGRFFAGVSEGIGYDLSEDPRFHFGPRIGLVPYRRQDADVRLNGTGDINWGAEAGGFFDATFAPWYAASRFGAGQRGARLELDGGLERNIGRSDRIRAGLEVNWANARYMQTYFGITPAQSAASGGVLTPYTASAGIRNYGANLGWMHQLGGGWFTHVSLGIHRIGGSAASSPLTMKRTMVGTSLVAGCRF